MAQVAAGEPRNRQERRHDYWPAALILMVLGRIFSLLGMRRVSTPSWNFASALSISRAIGRPIDREKDAARRSWRKYVAPWNSVSSLTSPLIVSALLR